MNEKYYKVFIEKKCHGDGRSHFEEEVHFVKVGNIDELIHLFDKDAGTITAIKSICLKTFNTATLPHKG